MTLRRASWQGPATLDDEYRAFEKLPNTHLAGAGTQMLRLLPHLDEACSDLDVWGVTSHERLCLISTDADDAPWLVIIDPVPPNEYQVRFRMPASEAPWDQAMVWGRASNPEDACKMVRTGIERSGGWPHRAHSG